MDEQDLWAEYDRIMLGVKKNFSSAIFSGKSRESCQKSALAIMKYSFEHYLHWEPVDVKRYVNWDTIREMRLDTLVKHIIFPGELNAKCDLYYIACLLYPESIRYNPYDIVISTYKNVLAKKIYRFPKDFWDDEKGAWRARACFRYMVKNYLSFHSISEMYHYFAGEKGKKVIRDYQLSMPYELFYDCPLDYLHDAMPQTQKDEYLYHYLRFQAEYAANAPTG